MSNELIAAANALADTLEAENAALAALDLPRAGALLAEKQHVVAGFLAAQDAPLIAAQRAAFEPLARRLQSLSAENRTLLERAIAAQSRVIGVIARAAAPAVAPAAYSAHGALRHAARPAAFAVSAQA